MAKYIVTALAIVAAFCFATLSAAYWVIELQGQAWWIIATAVTLSVCVSLLVPGTAALAGRFGKTIFLATAIFFAGDCYQNAMGFQALKGLTVSSDVTAAQDRLDAARADLAALPLPDAAGAIRKASTWETLNTELTGRVESAEAALAVLEVPEVKTERVGLAMALLQLALVVVFGCLGRVKTETPVEAAQELNETDNVVVLRPKRMSEKDMQTWAKIARV